MKIDPYADQVVVRPDKESEMSKGGIFLGAASKEKQTRGEVVAVGPGAFARETGLRILPDAKVGDSVIYSKYAGTDVTIEGVDYVILKEKDLLAKVVV